MSAPAASPTPIKPDDQRPEHPDFWSKRFGEGVTPWDAGKAPAAFADFIVRQPAPLNTLIPGCGSAWEAAASRRAGLAGDGARLLAGGRRRRPGGPRQRRGRPRLRRLFHLFAASTVPVALRTRLSLRPAAQAVGRLGPARRRTAAARRPARRLFLHLRPDPKARPSASCANNSTNCCKRISSYLKTWPLPTPFTSSPVVSGGRFGGDGRPRLFAAKSGLSCAYP
jgi:hypothetical protein